MVRDVAHLQEYEKFTKFSRLACLLAKIAMVMPMAYAVSGLFATMHREQEDMDTGVLPIGAECLHACNCESTHCHFSSVAPGESLGDGNGCISGGTAGSSGQFCGICAALPPDSQCSATRIVWIEPTGVRSGQAVTWADTCRAARLGPDPSVPCLHEDTTGPTPTRLTCRDRRARDSRGSAGQLWDGDDRIDADYDGNQLRMMADDFGGGNCTDCQDCSLWLSRESPVDYYADKKLLDWVFASATTKVVTFILGNFLGLTT
jgi:hypothetical protein